MSNKGKQTEKNEEKVVTKYDRKMQRRKEAEEKEKRQKKITMVVCAVIAVALVCFIASFPIRTYMAVNETFVEINGEKITKVEFDYNYNMSINNYYAQYGSYLSYFGLDLSADLSTQMYSDTMSWKDYFEEMTIDSMKTNKALKAEADAAGFTFDAREEYAEMQDSLKAQAEEYGASYDDYLKLCYGANATQGRLEGYMKENIVISAYYAQVAEDKTPSDEAVWEYYEENVDSYDSVDYRLRTVDAQLPTEPTDLADEPAEEETEAEEGAEETAYEPSEAEIKFAMAEAREAAEEEENTIVSSGELFENQTKSDLNSSIQNWLFDGSRKKGDTTIIEDSYYNRYYVVAFEQRYLDESPSVDVRIIITQTNDAQTILDEWKSGEATEESFIELCKKYTEDTSAKDEGGLYEAIIDSGMDEDLSAWLYDGVRKEGDTFAITVDQSEQIYNYVVYYLGTNNPEWMLSARDTILSGILSEYLEGIAAEVEVKDVKGNLAFIKIREQEEADALAAEEAAAAEAENGEGEEEESTEVSE